MTDVSTFRCPSDPGVGLPALGRNNYVCCLGDTTDWLNEGGSQFNGTTLVWPDNAARARASCRGVFVNKLQLGFRDILDGTANTIIAGESVPILVTETIHGGIVQQSTLGDCPSHRNCVPRPIKSTRCDLDFGALPRAALARHRFPRQRPIPRIPLGRTVLLSTRVLRRFAAPNRELRFGGGDASTGYLPPSSRHQGGCHVIIADGAVKFVTDSIESGNQNSPTVHFNQAGCLPPGSASPYGLWGALELAAIRKLRSEESKRFGFF